MNEGGRRGRNFLADNKKQPIWRGDVSPGAQE
jgi:hypothetical protein